VLAVAKGWSTTQTLTALIIVMVIVVILTPGFISRRAKKRKP
jgi:hypothetical protein